MDKHQDIFLSTSDLEKLKLFEQVRQSKILEHANKASLDAYRDLQFDIYDINFRQIAAQMNKSYGSIYNTYDSIVHDMKVLLDKLDPSIRDIFAVSNDEYHYFLVKQSDTFNFMSAILEGSCQSFENFYQERGNSKATALRHLRSMRIFLKKFDIRVTYEPMRFVGDEKDIRLALGIMFWDATRGFAWPFKEFDQKSAVWLMQNALQQLRYSDFNEITFLLFTNFAAVSCLRSYHGHSLKKDPRINYIQYPHTNIYSSLLKDADNNKVTESGLKPIIKHFLDLPDSILMNETYNLYNLIHCSLNDIPYRADKLGEILDYVKEYDTTIYHFVIESLQAMPYDVQQRLNLDDDAMKLLQVNCVRIIIGILAFGNSYYQMVTFYAGEEMDMSSIDLPEYKKQIRTVLTNLVNNEEFLDFDDKVTLLTDTLYNVSLRLMVLSSKHFAVKVYPSIEEDFFYYVDLIGTLYALPYVELVDDSTTADLIITTSSTINVKHKSTAYMFQWNHDTDSIQYGQLLSLIRDIWTNEKISK
ncbi:helix-turn-helix domain-containing protein [Bombilactobacillus thymidiniphilus]|uniref:Helix-turn-helix domain-containing protein n=1 Tax=Bombilactobacillus thymidiniphilus TaxID=2923363 RepID=A0ABY4PCA4_9LACO|nr:helix-turn-helix domain-containing protein [Bombilactobacillus thymidiniphilus]UQS83220.1 helix-turn-helix domain-containing protein [Bombilactobacillus thymidiniphilus]